MSTKKEKQKIEPPRTPKGMRDILSKEYYSYQGFFEKAAEIATYYGFKPIETPLLEETRLYTSGVGASTDLVEKEMYEIKTKGGTQLTLRPEGTAGIMRAYIENGMQVMPQPIMLYYYGNFYRHERPQKGRLRELRQFGLEILGSEKSIADATIIKVAITTLAEAGHKNLLLSINSIGDKACRGLYKKELINYYKKHTGAICKDCKLRLKNNPLRLLDCKDIKCKTVKEVAPQSVSFLCDPCKQHFKEVLEYLETLKIEYAIDNNLVRGLDYYTRTVFEISTKTTEKLPTEDAEAKKENLPTILALAGGGRYDYLAKTIGYKKDIPGVGVGIGVDRVIMSPDFNQDIAPRILKRPKVFFIQFGFGAKLQSLSIIEILRKAKIPVVQSLSKDSLSSQLGVAEKMKIPYTIIMGQKEVIDGTVIVRNMDSRSQEEIAVERLPEYIRNLK